MLDDGEIDALFASNAPLAYLAGSPSIAPLFPDHAAREHDRYRRTGIFPIMHTVVAHRGLFEANPGLAQCLYRGFLVAKDAAADRYREARPSFQVTTMVPWMCNLPEENSAMFPENWFPYGIDANRKALETFLRYSHEQGLSQTPRAVDKLFAEELWLT
ncbi:hypothetical protein [Streptomyces murinus]|uniref:hypothetical protein n=1 Tax=Streptomyces murinus TaxID=33900 RepID=UPI003815D933